MLSRSVYVYISIYDGHVMVMPSYPVPMCYHWGLGVGHFHAHQPCATATSSGTLFCQPGDTENDHDAEPGPGVAEGSYNYDGHKSSAELGDNASYEYQSDNSELGLDDRDSDGWEDVESESDDGSDFDGNHDRGLGDKDEEEWGGGGGGESGA